MKKKVVIIVLSSLLSIMIFAGCGNHKAVGVESNTQTVVTSATEINAGVDINSNTNSTMEITTENIENTTQSVTEPTDQTEPGQILTEAVSNHLTLIMVGDILLHTPVENAALQEDGTYNFDTIFEHTKEELQAADLAIVNQEVIIGGEELGISGYPAFNAPYTVGDALVEAGFDVVCHGTNHALDKGKKGLLNCIAFWRENYPDMAVLGIHDSQESQDNIYIYEQDGMKIAILNYTYGTNGIAMPEGMPYAVDMLNEQKVITDIQKAEEMADFTVVCPH